MACNEARGSDSSLAPSLDNETQRAVALLLVSAWRQTALSLAVQSGEHDFSRDATGPWICNKARLWRHIQRPDLRLVCCQVPWKTVTDQTEPTFLNKNDKKNETKSSHAKTWNQIRDLPLLLHSTATRQGAGLRKRSRHCVFLFQRATYFVWKYAPLFRLLNKLSCFELDVGVIKKWGRGNGGGCVRTK